MLAVSWISRKKLKNKLRWDSTNEIYTDSSFYFKEIE